MTLIDTPRSSHPRAVAGPVGLEQVPMGGFDPDEVLVGVGEVLGDPGEVFAETTGAPRVVVTGPGGVERGTDVGAAVAVVHEVTAGREQRRARAQRGHRRSAGQRGALAEEVDVDAVAGEV